MGRDKSGETGVVPGACTVTRTLGKAHSFADYESRIPLWGSVGEPVRLGPGTSSAWHGASGDPATLNTSKMLFGHETPRTFYCDLQGGIGDRTAS